MTSEIITGDEYGLCEFLYQLDKLFFNTKNEEFLDFRIYQNFGILSRVLDEREGGIICYGHNSVDYIKRKTPESLELQISHDSKCVYPAGEFKKLINDALSQEREEAEYKKHFESVFEKFKEKRKQEELEREEYYKSLANFI